MVNVSWNDAVAFCNWLSKSEGLAEYYRLGDGKVEIAGGKGFRLPSEAEWEYACRAGTTTRYNSGDDPAGLVRVGNVWDSSTEEAFPSSANRLSGSDGYPFTSPVGRYRSNGFGLYDMHGNAFEWCEDWYGSDYYGQSPSRDPRGPSSGSSRVVRSSSWFHQASSCRSAHRAGSEPSVRYNNGGFRVLCRLESIRQSLNAWKGHADFANSSEIQRSILKRFRLSRANGQHSTENNQKPAP